jgi:nucleotide-binding universal stress UspA family protein
MRILLAVDGSPCSEVAVTEVARRPWPENSLVRVITVVETPMPPTVEAWALPADYFDELEAALEKRGREIVAGATAKLSENHSFRVESALVSGSPRSGILDEARAFEADLIVMGSHGYNAWKRFLLGSVSQAVVSHAECSVEVVRCSTLENSSEEQSPKAKKE